MLSVVGSLFVKRVSETDVSSSALFVRQVGPVREVHNRKDRHSRKFSVLFAEVGRPYASTYVFAPVES